VVTLLVFDLDLFEKVVELCEGVRVAISKEDFVILAVFGRVELERECQLVEVSDLARIRRFSS
jgi:hypothetical protein